MRSTARMVQLGGVAVAALIAILLFNLGSTRGEFGGSFHFDDGMVTSGVVDLQVGAATRTLELADMVPGDRAILELQLRNGGSLPLRLAVGVQSDGSPLGRAFEATVWQSSACDPIPAEAVWTPLRATGITPLFGTDVADPAVDDRMAPEGTKMLCYATRLPLAAANELQGKVATLTLVLDAAHDVAVTPTT